MAKTLVKGQRFWTFNGCIAGRAPEGHEPYATYEEAIEAANKWLSQREQATVLVREYEVIDVLDGGGMDVRYIGSGEF